MSRSRSRIDTGENAMKRCQVAEPRGVDVRDTTLGRGVFATLAYPRGELVGEVRGEILDDPDYGSDYCVDLGNNARMEPEPPFRFLNHSCEPNCELILWKTQQKQGRRYARAWVQTTRSIRRGEELTIDYGWPAEAAIPCRCHSRHCRGWIVHPDELHTLPVSPSEALSS